MTVLVVEPGREPYSKRISKSLSALKEEVGGRIEVIYPFDDPVALICNEEGKLLGLKPNRGLRDERGYVYDIIAGTFLVAGLTENDFTSLHWELHEKYLWLFYSPEVFLKAGDEIFAVPLIERPSENIPHAGCSLHGGDVSSLPSQLSNPSVRSPENC